MTKEILLTVKQTAILTIVTEGNGYENGKFSPCDLDQLIERLHYSPSKQAIHFSIRKLINKGMLFKGERVKRRERYRVLIHPTKEAREMFSGKLNSYLEIDENNFDLEI